MKVKDLIAALAKLDPGLDVLCYIEDESLVSNGKPVQVLSIDSVGVSRAEPLRGEHGEPMLRFGSGQQSHNITLINVTADF
jgi:hypothetical protein